MDTAVTMTQKRAKAVLNLKNLLNTMQLLRLLAMRIVSCRPYCLCEKRYRNTGVDRAVDLINSS